MVEPKWVITVQHHTKGPLIKGRISSNSAETFLDTGAMVNLISRDALQRLKPGVKF